MSQDTPITPPAAPKGDIPEYLPEELLPVYDWYREQGKQLLFAAGFVLLVALGTFAYLRHRENKAAEASAALLNAESVEGLENLNSQYGGGKIGPLIRIRLAKAYYNAGNYPEARATFQAFLKRNGTHELAAIAKLGLAATQEAEQSFEEARTAYAALAEAQPGHYLVPLAVMGQARCLAALQQKPAAFDLLDRLIVSKSGTPWEEMATDLRGVIERFEGFKSRSIFDQLDAVSKKLPPADALTTEAVLDAAAIKSAAVSSNDAALAVPSEPAAE